MKPIQVTVDVARPAADVFAFVSDFENNPRWQRGMVSCRWVSPPPQFKNSNQPPSLMCPSPYSTPHDIVHSVPTVVIVFG